MRSRVGIFKLGHENVACFVDGSKNASGTLDPNDKTQASITIGIGWECFSDVEEEMLHEAMEVALMRMGHVFTGCLDIGVGTDQYHYMFNHPDFTEACARAAWWCFKARPLIKKAWIKHHKKKKPTGVKSRKYWVSLGKALYEQQDDGPWKTLDKARRETWIKAAEENMEDELNESDT